MDIHRIKVGSGCLWSWSGSKLGGSHRQYWVCRRGPNVPGRCSTTRRCRWSLRTHCARRRSLRWSRGSELYGGLKLILPWRQFWPIVTFQDVSKTFSFSTPVEADYFHYEVLEPFNMTVGDDVWLLTIWRRHSLCLLYDLMSYWIFWTQFSCFHLLSEKLLLYKMLNPLGKALFLWLKIVSVYKQGSFKRIICIKGSETVSRDNWMAPSVENQNFLVCKMFDRSW